MVSFLFGESYLCPHVSNISAPSVMRDVLLQIVAESHFRLKETVIQSTAELPHYCNIQQTPPSVVKYAVELRISRTVR